MKAVLDPHGYADVRDGSERLGMQHLRAVVRKFGGFVVSDFVQEPRIASDGRITAQNSVDVAPDPEFVRA